MENSILLFVFSHTSLSISYLIVLLIIQWFIIGNIGLVVGSWAHFNLLKGEREKFTFYRF